MDGSFSGLIIKLRNELDERFPNEHKLITVLNIGNASTLSSDAIADCDLGGVDILGQIFIILIPYGLKKMGSASN